MDENDNPTGVPMEPMMPAENPETPMPEAPMPEAPASDTPIA